MIAVQPKLSSPLIVDMLREGLKSGKRPQLTIVSGSMQPLFFAGDRVVLQAWPADELQPGDVIVFAGEHDLFTHRLRLHHFASAQHFLITRGDRTLAYDAPWPVERYIGRVAARLRRGRTLSLIDGYGGRLQRHLARLALLEEQLFGDDMLPAQLYEDDAARLIGTSWRNDGLRRPIFIVLRTVLLLWRLLLLSLVRGERSA